MKPNEILKKAPGLKPAVGTLLLAKVYAESERAIIDKMQRAVLNDRVFTMKVEFLREGQNPRITDPSVAYLMRDADFDFYHAECQRRIKAMGYDVPKDHCPALIAERLLMEAEHAAIAAAAPITGISDALMIIRQKDGLAKYKKMVDLLCKLICSMPGYVPPQLQKH
jgi:hypothetical protein